MQALLELDCIPAGMELFPAADAGQWSLIKKVIDDSDYYILIVGGRYGSTTSDGISYTQKEYEYAESTGKPIIGFVHKNPDDIALGKSELNEDNRSKLNEFRELVQQRVIKYWVSPTELGSVVSRSLIQLIKSRPSSGWVRADKVPDVDATNEILRLRKKIDELEIEVEATKIEAPHGREELSQGSELITIKYSYRAVFFTDIPPKNTQKRTSDQTFWVPDKEGSTEISWDAIFLIIAPRMFVPLSEYKMYKYITGFLQLIATEDEKRDLKFSRVHTLEIQSNTFEVIKIQLRALGLIVEEMMEGEIAWKITSYGDYKMNQLLVVKPNNT